jgi:hypothetical protein
MERNRIILVTAAFLQLLLSFCGFINTAVQFQQKETYLQRRKRLLKRRRDDDELALAFTVAAVQRHHYNFRRFWVDARSNHWVNRVLDGVLLQGDEFAKTFRMNRNSFNAFHAFLGTYPTK